MLNERSLGSRYKCRVDSPEPVRVKMEEQAINHDDRSSSG